VLHSLGVVWTAAQTSKLVDRDRLLLLFPSLPAVRNTTTCNNRKRTTQSILILLFCRSTSLFASRFSFRFPLFSVSSGRRCDHRAAGLWVLSGLQLSVAGESVDGAVQEELEEDGGQIQVCECRCVRAGLEVVNGTPVAAVVWLDGGKSESLRERGSRVKKEMGRWVSGRRRWDAVWLWLLCFVWCEAVSSGLEETESKPGKGKKKMWLRCGGRGGCVWAEGAQLLASGKKGNLMKGEEAAASREMRKGRGRCPSFENSCL